MASTEPTLPMIRALIGIIGLLGVAYLFSSDEERLIYGSLWRLSQIIIAFGVLQVNGLNLWMDSSPFSVALQVSVEASAFVLVRWPILKNE